jgi:DNA-binding beta-propeller fold protein YncE
VTTLAGNGVADFKDGPVLEASFALPSSVAAADDGSLYVADTGNHCIRRIAADQVSTFSGKCEWPGLADGPAADARFNGPTDILLLDDGRLVVSEDSSHTLRIVETDGSVSTLAGTTGVAGFADGEPLSAKFWKPAGCVLDATTGLLLVADSGNHRVRALALDQEVSTYLGSGAAGLMDGPPLAAEFNRPGALALLPDGRLVVADTQNHAIRILLP